MRLADLIGGVVVLILGLAVIYFSSQLEYYSEFGPGPGFLPLWIGICITGFAIYLLSNILRKHKNAGVFFKPRTREGFKLLIIIIATFFLLPLLGFSIGFGLFAGITMRCHGKTSLGHLRSHSRRDSHRHSLRLWSLAEHPTANGHRGMVERD